MVGAGALPIQDAEVTRESVRVAVWSESVRVAVWLSTGWILNLLWFGSGGGCAPGVASGYKLLPP